MGNRSDDDRALPDSDLQDSDGEETTAPTDSADDTKTQPPEDPDDPLNDPEIKICFDKIRDLAQQEDDVEVELGRQIIRADYRMKENKTRHRNFGKLLEANGISYKKASRARAHANFHAWAETTGNLDQLSKVPRSACYLLGAPKTTDEKREEVIRRVKKDDGIDIETVKRIVGRTKQSPEDESDEEREFRLRTDGFDRWLKKFNKADVKVRKRVINDICEHHREFVTLICLSADLDQRDRH